MTKKLFRSRTDRVFAGVCGGLGEYFGVDSTMFRLVFLLFIIFTGFVPGIIFYIISILIIPSEAQVNTDK